ncbi:MAG: ABC transporter permease [candidate division Zixibacteria bacterium]|nr:ABC transporter permease [candidate division Zixibacteria bacterium]
MNRLKFIALKELYHILRDPRSLLIVFLMPVMMTFLYGYAINLDVEDVVIAVVDQDRTDESRELVDRFYNSAYFSRPENETSLTDPEALLRSTEAAAVLLIKPGFGRAVERGDKFYLSLMVDGSDNALSAAVQSYANQVLLQFLKDRLPAGYILPGIQLSLQVKYNPDLKSSHFFVPGLVAIILIMISALLTSITIAREKETGTMEQLLTAPVKTHDILLGKLIPYIVIAFLDGTLILVFAKLVFGVPFIGSHLLLLLFGFIYVTTSLSIGILISAAVNTQQLAMMFALTLTMLPSVMLSGFIFPIKNMPFVLQALSHIVPARYFLTIIRGIMLKGAGLGVFIGQGAMLVLLMVIFLFIAVKSFNRGTA